MSSAEQITTSSPLLSTAGKAVNGSASGLAQSEAGGAETSAAKPFAEVLEGQRQPQEDAKQSDKTAHSAESQTDADAEPPAGAQVVVGVEFPGKGLPFSGEGLPPGLLVASTQQAEAGLAADTVVSELALQSTSEQDVSLIAEDDLNLIAEEGLGLIVESGPESKNAVAGIVPGLVADAKQLGSLAAEPVAKNPLANASGQPATIAVLNTIAAQNTAQVDVKMVGQPGSVMPGLVSELATADVETSLIVAEAKVEGLMTGKSTVSDFAAKLLGQQLASNGSVGATDVAAEISLASLEKVAKQVNAFAAVRPEAAPVAREAFASPWQTDIATTVGKPGWGDAVTQKVMWMSSQNVQQAEIALDPPELGSLQVKVTMQNDQTSVVFTSPNASVREALDQNIMRLREMMNGEGVNLADVDVADQNTSGQREMMDEPESPQQARADEVVDADELEESVQMASATAVGLVSERV